MRKLKDLLNRPRLRALAARPLNGGPVCGCRSRGEDCVALSFDDGPSAANTGQLLEPLEGYGARATSLVVAAVLFAFDPANSSNGVLKELLDSSQAGTRDTMDVAAMFTIPLVANGKVFVTGQSQPTAYGLLP